MDMVLIDCFFKHLLFRLDRSQSVFYFVPQERHLTVKQARLISSEQELDGGSADQLSTKVNCPPWFAWVNVGGDQKPQL